MALNYSAYQDGTLGALMKQPGAYADGSLGVLVAQPKARRDGVLGGLMKQPGAYADGSLGATLMRQPGAYADGSLGRLGKPGGFFSTLTSRPPPTAGQFAVAAKRRAAEAARAAARQQAAAAKARAVHGLGDAATLAAKMNIATNRGVCMQACQRQPKTFGRCIKTCAKQYPLQGLGEMTTTNWLWIAGGVAVVGALVFMAKKR